MTRHRSFKRIVRARMAKTGESYTAARSSILSAAGADETGAPVMPQSDSTVRERTGEGWEHWLAELDEWGASERNHTEIARHLREDLELDGWWAQTIAVGYERARGRRAVGETAHGFTANASRTINVPVEALFDASWKTRAGSGGSGRPSSRSAPRRGRRARGSTGGEVPRG